MNESSDRAGVSVCECSSSECQKQDPHADKFSRRKKWRERDGDGAGEGHIKKHLKRRLSPKCSSSIQFRFQFRFRLLGLPCLFCWFRCSSGFLCLFLFLHLCSDKLLTFCSIGKLILLLLHLLLKT